MSSEAGAAPAPEPHASVSHTPASGKVLDKRTLRDSAAVLIAAQAAGWDMAAAPAAGRISTAPPIAAGDEIRA